jgi:hypothetical protein
LLCISFGFCHCEGKDQVPEEEVEVSNRRRIRRRHMLWSRQVLELESKRERLLK